MDLEFSNQPLNNPSNAILTGITQGVPYIYDITGAISVVVCEFGNQEEEERVRVSEHEGLLVSRG